MFHFKIAKKEGAVSRERKNVQKPERTSCRGMERPSMIEGPEETGLAREGAMPIERHGDIGKMITEVDQMDFAPITPGPVATTSEAHFLEKAQ